MRQSIPKMFTSLNLFVCRKNEKQLYLGTEIELKCGCLSDHYFNLLRTHSKLIKYNIMSKITLYVLAILCFFTQRATATALTLNGGEIVINGSVTATYLDFQVDFTANVQWLAMIWSQNEADTDVTLLKINANNPATPVSLVDCYLDQNSYIQVDNVQNLMPSGTAFKGDTSTGIKAAFKRELITGDSRDITLYANSVIQVCFMCANEAFKGNGYQEGNEKVCTYISLHKNVNANYDRALGNYASTATFGGGNLTFYAVQSSEVQDVGTWLFLSVVHKAQGLSTFAPRWIGMLYNTSFNNADMALIQYTTIGVNLDIQIKDYYAVNASFSNADDKYVVGQGSQDLMTVLTAYDSSSYFVGSFKRKFLTGDVNRDQKIVQKQNTYCFVYGNALSFSTFSYNQQICLNFSLTTEYSSNFRQTSSTSVQAQTYTAPSNQVKVLTLTQVHLVLAMIVLSLLLLG